MATIRQQNAIKNLVANGGNVAKAMRDAGYSKRTARTPSKLTKSVGGATVLDPFIAKMIKERERLIKAMSQKNLTKEKYRDMIEGFDKFTKNIQLLNGGKTSNDKIEISWQD